MDYTVESEVKYLQGLLSSTDVYLNDLKRDYYRAQTGLDYYSVNDLERIFLQSRTGSTVSKINDLWNLYFNQIGVASGSLSDRKKDFFENYGHDNPRAISGCVLWLDPGISTVTETAGAISAIADLSGQGNNAVQTTEANQPALVADGIGGKPAIQGDGDNDYLSIANAKFNAINAITIVNVLKYSTAVGDDQMLITRPAGTSDQLSLADGKPRLALLLTDIGSQNAVTDDALTANSSYIITAMYDGSAITLYVNGTAVKQTTGLSGTLANEVAGTDDWQWLTRAGTQDSDSPTSFLAIYNKALSDTELAAIHSYLSSRFGITLS
jgi:hypothetical protein